MPLRKNILRLSLAALIALVGFAIFDVNQFSPSLNDTSTFSLVNAFPNLSFNRPVDFQHPNDGTNRVFVVEQVGKIHIFNNSPDASSTKIFLDITDRVSRVGNEEGLLGLAFHPDYQKNSYFYVYYSAANPRRSILARYNVSSVDSNAANMNSELVLMEIPQPYSNHNGGQITFGPDGYLYIGLGDGGSGGDPLGHGQNTSTLLGAILRIDINNPTNGRHYGIPADNPFVGNQLGYREEIWAYGLRNPWRFSFDLATGWLWAADVGQNSIEEIDIIEVGGNYGWNIKEGSECYNPLSSCDSQGLVDPIWEYSHSVGQSITGGYVYRGTKLPHLQGYYIFGDFMSGRLWALAYNGSDIPTVLELLDTSLALASFGIDQENEIYILAFNGEIYQLEHEAPSDDSSSEESPSERGFTKETSVQNISSEESESKSVSGWKMFFAGIFVLTLIASQRKR